MSARVDEDRVVLDALDFDIPCSECGGAATWAITLVCCDRFTAKCVDCFARWETVVARSLGREVECTLCGHSGPLTWDWYRTVKF